MFTKEQFKVFFDKLLAAAAFIAKFTPGDTDDKIVAALKQIEDEVFGLLQQKGMVK